MTQNLENIWESQETSNKIGQNHDELKALYKRKIDEYMDWEKNKNPNIFEKKINAWWELEKFKKFLSATGDQVLFPEKFLTSDFAKNTLKTAIISYVMSRKNLFSSVEKSFQNQFDFSFDNSLFPKVQEEYKKLPNQTLKELWMYASFREKYIISLFKATPDVLEKILTSHENDEKLLKAIFGNIPNEIRQNQEALFSLKKLEQAHNIHLDDLKNILNILENNVDAKKTLISYFFPNISLQDAIDLGVISKTEAEIQILKVFKNIFKSQDQFFSTEDIKASIPFIDTRSIFISTQSLNDTQWNGIFDDKKNTQFLTKITKEINALNANLKEDLDFASFEDFQKQVQISSHISSEIKSQMLKLQKGSYMILSQNTEKWKSQNHYFYLNNTTNNLGFVNITREWWNVTKNNTWIPDVQTFEDFFQRIVDVSNNSTNIDLKVYNSWEFKDHIDATNIQEIAESEDVESIKELISLMDEVDPEFKKFTGVDQNQWFSFRCKPLSVAQDTPGVKKLVDEEVFKVTKIDENGVHIEWQEPLSLWEFAKAFSQRKPKRFPTMDWVDTFFTYWKQHENYSEALKWLKLKNNKIIQEEDDSKKTPSWVEYFLWDNKQAIQILKLDDGTIDFIEGEFNESKDNKKASTFKWKIKGKWISYNDFYLYITEKKFKPYTKNLEVKPSDDNAKNTFKSKKWFLSSWMWFLSLTEIIAWWKMYISAIEEHLKTWNKLKSAKFALAMWKFLPDEIKSELENVVEWEEKKIMEDTMSKLKGKNTADMIKAIEKILFASNPYDPQLEAALMTTISKFHFLYPKGLSKYKWQFLWYQALWWKIWDETYNKYKAQCEADSKVPGSNPVPFTEEFLIEELLKKQVGVKKRRNKFDKDYGKYRGQWLWEELEDWGNKTSDFATLDGRLWYCIGEFENLTYANGIWWMENVWAKWPDPWFLMNTLPFVILVSWMSMDLTQPLVNKVKSYAYTTAFSSLALISNEEKLKKYNQYVTKVIDLMWNTKMKSAFQSLGAYGNQSEKIKATYKFWTQYWAELYPKINMNDGFVISEKDKEWNEILKWYYDTIKSKVHDTDDFKNGMKKDDIEGWFIDIDNNPIAATGAGFDKIGFVDGWKYNSKVSYKYLKMHLDYFNKVISDDTIPLEKRKELFFDIYKKIERHIFSEISWFISRWWPQWYKSYTCVIDARKGWIEVFPEKFTDENETFLDSAYEQKLEQKWQEFLHWNTKEPQSLEWNIWNIKSSIEEILNFDRNASNEENYKAVA